MKPLAFFFDRNFPRPIARLIEHYEQQFVARHQDDDGRFEIDTPDIDIIRALAADDGRVWVMITGDKHILTRPAERAVLVSSGVKYFCFGRAWFRMRTHEQAWRFLRVWPEVIEVAANHRARLFEIEGQNLKIVRVD